MKIVTQNYHECDGCKSEVCGTGPGLCWECFKDTKVLSSVTETIKKDLMMKIKWNKTEKLGGPDDQGSATSKCGRFRITKQYFGMVGCRWHWHIEVRVDLNAEGEDEHGQGWTGNWSDDDGNVYNWDDRGNFRTITEAKAFAAISLLLQNGGDA